MGVKDIYEVVFDLAIKANLPTEVAKLRGKLEQLEKEHEREVQQLEQQIEKLERARMNRDAVRAKLKAEGIQTKGYFYPPLHEQTLFQRVACRRSDRMERTMVASREALALPLYSHMTLDQLDSVCQAVEHLLA